METPSLVPLSIGPAIAAPRVQGQVGHRPQGRPPKGQLTRTAERASLGAERLPLGTRELSVAAARVGAVNEATVMLTGLKPGGLTATVQDLVLEQLVLTPR